MWLRSCKVARHRQPSHDDDGAEVSGAQSMPSVATPTRTAQSGSPHSDIATTYNGGRRRKAILFRPRWIDLRRARERSRGRRWHRHFRFERTSACPHPRQRSTRAPVSRPSSWSSHRRRRRRPSRHPLQGVCGSDHQYRISRVQRAARSQARTTSTRACQRA